MAVVVVVVDVDVDVLVVVVVVGVVVLVVVVVDVMRMHVPWSQYPGPALVLQAVPSALCGPVRQMPALQKPWSKQAPEKQNVLSGLPMHDSAVVVVVVLVEVVLVLVLVLVLVDVVVVEVEVGGMHAPSKHVPAPAQPVPSGSTAPA